MKLDIYTLSNEEICEFLLNGKKADALELNPQKADSFSGFTERTVYKDKSVEIVFSYLKIADDDIIQQFFIYSQWWGKIKNSFFTCDGFKGKSEMKCGVININGLQESDQKSAVRINNKNTAADIKITDFASLVLYCQRKFKASPTYEVAQVISLSPSLIEIRIAMPDGKTYFSQGANKKEAANAFALTYEQLILT